MANLKSQKKRIKTDHERRQRNRGVRSRIKTQIRRVELAVEEGRSEDARAALREASGALDKAADKGAVHRNYAARHKSRLARKVSESG